MDDTRIQRRMRARSYDLRRKVLLKNFLRDQMTHYSETSTEPFSSSENFEESPSFTEESSVAETIEQTSSIAEIDTANAVHSPPDSSDVDDDYNTNDNCDDAVDLMQEIDVVTTDNNFDIAVKHKPISVLPSLVKFTGLFKKDPKSSSKSVFKAKKVVKSAKSSMQTRSFKKSFEKVFYGHKKSNEKASSGRMTKNSSRSYFSLFKHRREQRHAKDNGRTTRSSDNHVPNNSPSKRSSMNQSVQTDGYWVKYEMNEVQESNKRLKEENKLLSQSLSYFMTNASTDPHVRQHSSPYQSSYESESSLMFHDYTLPRTDNSQGSWNARSKVSRSKSVHEFNERHMVLRNNYRTKSMNVHNSRNYFLSNSRPLLSSFADEANTPRLRKRPILTDIPTTSTIRTIQRRSSMSERTLSENNRWVSHGRSNSMKSSHTRKPFYALSDDAFY